MEFRRITTASMYIHTSTKNENEWKLWYNQPATRW